ncbi:MAG: hypothetical protein HDR80_01110 [Bacteroides sp.]|nr:hypothetical protein [Bacteroides sp.]
MRILRLILTAAALTLLFLSGCGGDADRERMDRAESLMLQAPDSALALLTEVDSAALRGRADQARFALLRSQAIDKTGTDLETLDYLRPAMDYYYTHGTPDQRLRTYYYEGRIHQNAGDKDAAMQAFLHAEDLHEQITDSLTLGNLYFATAYLQLTLTNVDYARGAYLSASKIYSDIGMRDRAIGSLSNALNSAIVSGSKAASDSILAIVDSLNLTDVEYRNHILSPMTAYYDIFNDKDGLKRLLRDAGPQDSTQNALKINMIQGYLHLGMVEEASNEFATLPNPSTPKDSSTYLAVKSELLEAKGNYKEALEVYKEFSDLLLYEDQTDLQQKLTFSTQQHLLEKQRLRTIEQQRQHNLILIATSIILVLLLTGVCLTYRNYKKRKELEDEVVQFRMHELEQEKSTLEQLVESSTLSTMMRTTITDRLKLVDAFLIMKLNYSKTRERNADKLFNNLVHNR